MKKTIWIIAILILAIVSGAIWYKYFFVFGEGVKSGSLNYIVRKGYVFKTYEGKLIQDGFGRGKTGGLTSYEFEFSVTDPEVAKQLERNSGKYLDLRYKEYNGALPWRGNTKYVVDKVMNIQ